jgi:hypothetical protein
MRKSHQTLVHLLFVVITIFLLYNKVFSLAILFCIQIIYSISLQFLRLDANFKKIVNILVNLISIVFLIYFILSVI